MTGVFCFPLAGEKIIFTFSLYRERISKTTARVFAGSKFRK
jgi:hypothetical protein